MGELIAKVLRTRPRETRGKRSLPRVGRDVSLHCQKQAVLQGHGGPRFIVAVFFREFLQKSNAYYQQEEELKRISISALSVLVLFACMHSYAVEIPPPGKALDFDGADDAVQLTNSASFQSVTGALTVEAWVKADDINNEDTVFMAN